MKTAISISALLFVLAVSACQPGATAVPTSAFTAVPTRTALPTPTPTRTLPLPTETPEAFEWNGFPIMPGALAGEGDSESYGFTIQASPRDVQEYFELELGKLGWRSSIQGDGQTSLMLIFMKDASATLTVTILSEGDESLVFLVK
ncbi:MAG: hypothetical protein WCC12_14360 [Anaerolineales bacterium]